MRWLPGAMVGVLACSVSLGAAAGKAPHKDDVLRAALSNGLRVIIVGNALAPVVTTIVNYRVGSDECPEGFPGTAHGLEHMMFRGSPGLSADQLAGVTAALGGDSNADTQQAITQYFFTAPAEDLEVAQDLSNPEYVFSMKLLKAMFYVTPYAHDAVGTRPSFDKTTDAMLRSFHNAWHAPNNAILVIVGDLRPAPRLDQVKKLFGGIPAGKLPARPGFHFTPVKAETLRIESDLPYGMAAVTFRFPGSDSPDYVAARVLAGVLGSQRGELYGLVPAGNALAASFSCDTLPKASLGYATAEFPAGADAAALVGQMRTILAAEAANGVPADLVEAAKRREFASAELQKKSVFGLGMAWSQAVALEGRQSPEDDVQAIRRVTVAEVDRVAREYLDLDHAIVAILTPQPFGKPVSTKSFGGSESRYRHPAPASAASRPPAGYPNRPPSRSGPRNR